MALILAAVLAVLAGLAGLVFDFGRAWVVQTDLQAAVDAAALAGATQLDGQTGARGRAVLAAAGAAARNNETFAQRHFGAGPVFDAAFACQGDGCAMSNGSFRFFSALTPRVEALSDAEARVIEVSVSRRMRLVFAGLIGAPGAVSPRVSAAAAWNRYACGRAALLLCNPDEPVGNLSLRAVFDPAPHFGKGIALRTGLAPGPGAMAWLAAVTCDPADDSCTVARCRELGRRPGTGPTEADLPWRRAGRAAGDRHPGTGAEHPAGCLSRLRSCRRSGVSAKPQFPKRSGAQAGAVVGGQLPQCDFSGALVPAAQPYLGPGRHPPQGATPLDHIGYPRDTCAYPQADGSAPAPNCMAVAPLGSGLPSGRALGTGVWDLPVYMTHHHPAVDLTGYSFNLCPAGACRLGADDTVDLDRNGRLSRWEVYSWELGGHLPAFGRPQCFGGGAAALPQPPAGAPPATDRRLLGAVVANCRAIAAAFGPDALTEDLALPLAGGISTVTLFLSEAVGELAPEAIYGEIVDPGAILGPKPVVGRDRVVLRE